jgi:hypothetical protein
MAEFVWTKETTKRAKITLLIVLVGLVLMFVRIVKSGDDRVLIFSADTWLSWVLFPTTIHTYEGGEIHLRFFTQVSHSNGYLSGVYNPKGNIKHNFTFQGNKVENFFSVGLSDAGGGFSYYNLDDPQPFELEGVELQIESYRVRRNSDEPDLLCIYDFEKIVLADGTVIYPGFTVKPYFWLKYGLDEWELYYNSPRAYFTVNNPSWEEEKKIWRIIFEKNWGKIISYEESIESDYP